MSEPALGGFRRTGGHGGEVGGPTEAAYRHVMDNLHNGAVILLHNVSSPNAAALDRILRDIKARGYRFGTLDEISSAGL